MGLEGTSLQDKEGAGLYFVHNGTMRQLQELESIANQINAKTTHQIHMLEYKSHDGAYITSFYGFNETQLPLILVIRDDDQLAHSWYGSDRPSVDHLVASLSQISHS